VLDLKINFNFLILFKVAAEYPLPNYNNQNYGNILNENLSLRNELKSYKRNFEVCLMLLIAVSTVSVCIFLIQLIYLICRGKTRPITFLI
jgi:hypothetical protein